eukprot:TRINITY_DN3744_c0_g1_i1.p2 TRINITY_DN3744_c0_g1~~TRINITY_DN3744_c0_g1_i1.p2  ORF type:complete len:56 (-),score=8.01 TRINITY_DN3744_c0_g1_i1:153-320(-)
MFGWFSSGSDDLSELLVKVKSLEQTVQEQAAEIDFLKKNCLILQIPRKKKFWSLT